MKRERGKGRKKKKKKKKEKQQAAAEDLAWLATCTWCSPCLVVFFFPVYYYFFPTNSWKKDRENRNEERLQLIRSDRTVRSGFYNHGDNNIVYARTTVGVDSVEYEIRQK